MSQINLKNAFNIDVKGKSLFAIIIDIDSPIALKNQWRQVIKVMDSSINHSKPYKTDNKSINFVTVSLWSYLKDHLIHYFRIGDIIMLK